MPALPHASYLNETTLCRCRVPPQSPIPCTRSPRRRNWPPRASGWLRHPFVTIDTEFLRETTYYPLLCVAQMASPDEAVVVDALAPGIDLAPFYALMADEKVHEGVSRRAPGHRNHLARRKNHSASDLRHPGRRHGARLWQFHLLRPAGAAHHRRHARQIAPFHRLDAPATVRGATHLRHFRRHPSARRLSRAGRRSRPPRPRRLGRGRDAGADLARDLPHGSAERAGSGSRPACASPRSSRC